MKVKVRGNKCVLRPCGCLKVKSQQMHILHFEAHTVKVYSFIFYDLTTSLVTCCRYGGGCILDFFLGPKTAYKTKQTPGPDIICRLCALLILKSD